MQLSLKRREKIKTFEKVQNERLILG